MLIRPTKQIYPNSPFGFNISSGDWGIVACELEELLEGQLPKTNKYGNLTIKGNLPSLSNNSVYKVTATLDTNDKYGDSYNIVFINREVSLDTAKDQENFLMEILTSILAESRISLKNQNMHNLIPQALELVNFKIYYVKQDNPI